MALIHLAEFTLANFRNFTLAKLEPHKRFNIVSGRNGMGKTNLLEALYLLGALRSFRTTTRQDLIRHQAENAKVSGTFSGAAAGMQCQVELGPSSRQVRIDGKAPPVFGEHFRNLPMVLFHPATMSLVQGGPDARRRFLDRALFQASPGYPALHRDYTRALANRNKLLKSETIDQRSLAPYDEQLADLGSQIFKQRANIVSLLEPLFKEAFESISQGLDGGIVYKPKVEGGKDELKQALADRLVVDRARRYTTVGPHKDEVELTLDNLPARKFASQGQQRMIVLALKIAETRVLADSTQRTPILLLDDISSELDRDRNRALFDFLAKTGGQVFITTTHLDHILIDKDRKDFQLNEGTLSPL
jgi:DNA replication and repair protein RecF